MPHDYYYPLILILGALVAAYFLLRRRSCKKPTAVVDPKPIPVPTVVPGKFYLGIALSHVDSRRYNGWEGKLGGTIPDVKLFEKNLSLRGFKTQLVLDGAATRQTKAMRFFCADTISDDLRQAALNAMLAHAFNQIIFDATARD